jgi:hypothetical protein
MVQHYVALFPLNTDQFDPFVDFGLVLDLHRLQFLLKSLQFAGKVLAELEDLVDLGDGLETDAGLGLG